MQTIKNLFVFAATLVTLEENIKKFNGTIVYKKRKNEYYHQYFENGKRHQDYIRKDDLQNFMQKFELKKAQKRLLIQMKEQLKMFDPLKRKKVRGAMTFCQETGVLHTYQELNKIEKEDNERRKMADLNHMKFQEQPKDITLEGIKVRSRAEIVCVDVARSLGLSIEYEPKIFNDQLKYVPDFSVKISKKREKEQQKEQQMQQQQMQQQKERQMVQNKKTQFPNMQCSNGTAPPVKSFYWEHFGKLNDINYRKKQIQKIKDYCREGIELGKNLVITCSKNHYDERTILWSLIKGEVITPREAAQLYRKSKACIMKSEEYPFSWDELEKITEEAEQDWKELN